MLERRSNGGEGTQDVLSTASEWWLQMTRPFSPGHASGEPSDGLMELVDRSFDSVAQLMDIQREFIKAFLGMVSNPEVPAR